MVNCFGNCNGPKTRAMAPITSNTQRVETERVELSRSPHHMFNDLSSYPVRQRYVNPNGVVYKLSPFGCAVLGVPGYEQTLRDLMQTSESSITASAGNLASH
eukprot:GHVL01003426.1.p1 GENE.GHVL01003426.1~~GHVL01003426.1.p1  ORF type:complete len:102 (+),score=4.19 GHVL01003426.1:111-416(+)